MAGSIDAADAGGMRAVPPRSTVTALVVAARPKQWIKNVLVFAAPAAAGVLDSRQTFVDTVVAFVAFCLAASGTYFLNDALDVDLDRRHPEKRHRPIAAGHIGIVTAHVVGVGLIVAGLAVSFAAQWELVVTVGAYVVMTTTYTFWLKRVPVLDIVIVAGGFILRAIAGGTATGVPISNWFFIVAAFGSLFMVSGKRHAEQHELGVDAAEVRATLGEYTSTYLAYLRSVSSGVVLVAYSLWAFEKADLASSTIPWFQMSIAPFAVAILRYAMLVDLGRGAAPEDLVLSDALLLAAGASWALLFALGVYT